MCGIERTACRSQFYSAHAESSHCPLPCSYLATRVTHGGSIQSLYLILMASQRTGIQHHRWIKCHPLNSSQLIAEALEYQDNTQSMTVCSRKVSFLSLSLPTNSCHLCHGVSRHAPHPDLCVSLLPMPPERLFFITILTQPPISK